MSSGRGRRMGGMSGKRQERDEPRNGRKSRKNGKSKWRLMELSVCERR